jgi:hypothetical protein
MRIEIADLQPTLESPSYAVMLIRALLLSLIAIRRAVG